MKRKKCFHRQCIILIILATISLSCSHNSMNDILKGGLKKYPRVRHINQSLVEGYTIKKLAFFTEDSINYEFVFQLDSLANKGVISKYSIGMVVFSDKKYMEKDRDYLMWLNKPEIQMHKNFKYLIWPVQTSIKRMDSIHIFLTGRDGYTGVYGNMIRLKNIQL